MNNAGQHANGFTHGKNLDRTAGEFIGAPLKGRAKRKTVSLERLSTELSGALRDRRCAWSKDLSPTQQGTDRPFPPSTKDWEVLKPPKNSWRDHRVKSARRRGKVPSQSQSGDERYHDAPPPTASNRKDAQLSTTVCKRDDGGNHQSENFAQACRYLPRSLESSFSKRKKKKEKKGGVIQRYAWDLLSEGKSILKSFVSLENILHLVDEDMVWNVERYSVGGMGYLKQSSEGRISRVKYSSREDRITMSWAW